MENDDNLMIQNRNSSTIWDHIHLGMAMEEAHHHHHHHRHHAHAHDHPHPHPHHGHPILPPLPPAAATHIHHFSFSTEHSRWPSSTICPVPVLTSAFDMDGPSIPTDHDKQYGKLLAQDHVLEADQENPEKEEEEEEEELGAMKEMMYKIAAMQPVDIDPATIHKPKRKNVRCSDDPQSVAARHRRERISEKIRILQRLVPGGTKMDTASMLEEAIRYVKFLKRQIRILQSSNREYLPAPLCLEGHHEPTIISSANSKIAMTIGSSSSSFHGQRTEGLSSSFPMPSSDGSGDRDPIICFFNHINN